MSGLTADQIAKAREVLERKGLHTIEDAAAAANCHWCDFFGCGDDLIEAYCDGMDWWLNEGQYLD